MSFPRHVSRQPPIVQLPTNVSFDHGYLHEHLIPKHARSYQSATPFPHVVIEQMLPPEIVAAVASEISEVMLPSGCVPGASACYHKRGVHIGKSELHDRSHGPYTKALFAALRGRTFVRSLERLSGVHPLIPDPGYQGSGVHLTGKGGILKVHHDFNYMLCRELGVEEGAGEGGGAGERRGARGGEGGASGSGSRFGDCVRGASHHVGGGAERRHRLHRRVNVFVYLNADWPEHYGGHLELWNRNMTRCHRRIAPTIGRFVAFSSSDYSFHGHPQVRLLEMVRDGVRLLLMPSPRLPTPSSADGPAAARTHAALDRLLLLPPRTARRAVRRRRLRELPRRALAGSRRLRGVHGVRCEQARAERRARVTARVSCVSAAMRIEISAPS